MKKLFSQLGFTLIELLVVISVIGVLAVAVLSSINPIEQINKGRDTRTRSDAAQLINAVDRFYATQEIYPWNDPLYACGKQGGAGGVCAPVTDGTASIAFPTAAGFAGVCTAQGAGTTGAGMCKVDNTGAKWMDALTHTSEVKVAFVSRVRAEGDKQGGYAIFTYKGAAGTGADDTMYACFVPSSEAFKQEAVQVCSNTGKGAGVYTALPAAIQAAVCPGTNPGLANYVATSPSRELICLP